MRSSTGAVTVHHAKKEKRSDILAYFVPGFVAGFSSDNAASMQPGCI